MMLIRRYFVNLHKSNVLLTTMKRLFITLSILIASLSTWALQPERGYRGFIASDNFLGINIGFIAGEPGDSQVSTGIITSHGYQFNRWLYLGGGTGFIYNLDWKNPSYAYWNDKMQYVIPVFAEVRLDAKWGRFTPYLSSQIGANVAGRGGLYFSPMFGYRFNWGRRSAINFGLGMTMYGNTFTGFDHTCTPDGQHIDTKYTIRNGNAVEFTARIGFEFQLPRSKR